MTHRVLQAFHRRAHRPAATLRERLAAEKQEIAAAARAVIRHGRYWGGPAQRALDPARLQDTAGSAPT